MTDLPKARFRNGRILFALMTLALLAFMIKPTQGQSDYRVGLVVRHSNGEVVKQCVDIGAPTASGYDVLIASGLDLSIEAQSMGTVICSINGEGCSFPQQSCFCACMSSPCTYWSYWQRQDNQWVYANLGASQSTVQAGSVEGWSWGEGTINASADYPPPDVSYAEICEPEQAAATAAAEASAAAEGTAMAIATQTAAAPSTATPLPTENRAATATPTLNPGEPPLITYLAPDRERIRGGESAVLTWETSRATTVALRANGTEQSVALAGSITLTPDVTTIYRLIARNSVGEDAIDVTIAVDPSEPTPTATPLPATMTPEAGASPSDAEPVVPIQSATEPPTSTPTSTPTATMMPSATPTEPPIAIDTSTPTPILLATLTPTPILLATLTPTPTPTPTSTEAAVALAETGALPPAASNRNAPTAPNAEALAAVDASVMADSVTDSVTDPVADPVADTGALRGAFGAMLLVMGAPLIAAGLALVVLRLRKRENA